MLVPHGRCPMKLDVVQAAGSRLQFGVQEVGSSAKSLKDAGFNAQQLKDVGLSMQSLMPYSAHHEAERKIAGCNARELKNAGLRRKKSEWPDLMHMRSWLLRSQCVICKVLPSA
eukprot:12423168-Karenia_brevis.AAC.1